ncbi:MAG: type III pantothenate kinase [Candidatus Omnitrophica bacterium]|nr:type III pantothenate kinase [Candidatus Omnitrophota bacterium]
MLLAIDIGNTTIGLAVMTPKGVVRSVSVIDTNSKAEKIKTVVAGILKHDRIAKAVICSVVPQACTRLENILKKRVPVFVIGRDILVPIKNGYKYPKQVGQDRLVGAFAAMKIYGPPLIVVDLGTATTFDVVSPKGEYLGGAIVPGLRLSAESLFLKTALLPRTEIKPPRHIIGKTTQESIQSGLFYGYGSLCRGLIDLLNQKLKTSCQVVMTGGYARLMKGFVSPKMCKVDENLVFKGIYFCSSG